MLTANQIYKKSGSGLSFNTWIDKINKQYHKSNSDLKPIVWLNANYKDFGADWLDSLTNAVNTFSGGSLRNEEYQQNLARQEQERLDAMNTKKILGMEPYIAYTLFGTIVIAAGVGVYFIIKKYKK